MDDLNNLADDAAKAIPEKKKKPRSTTIVAEILSECLEIHAERHIQYGPSENNFADTAEIATRLSLDGKKITLLDVATFMVAIKEARYKYQYKLWQDFLLAADEEDLEDDDLNEDELAVAHNHDEKVLHDSLIDWINYLAIMENIRILTK